MKKFVSFLLVLIMVLGLIPASVVAAEAETLSSIVLDFMSFATEVSGQNLWRSLRTTGARGVKALGMKYGEQPTAKYTQALKDLEKWMDANYDWSIPDLHENAPTGGHYNHPYGARRIYIDSYSGNYGIRLYSDYPGNGYGECKFYLNVEVPAGKGGTYKMLVESFDEALQSVVPSCEGSDNGGATATFYLNGEQVGEQETFASDIDEIVVRDYRRVQLKEGTNALQITIDGDRNGNAAAGRAAMNLRSISFVDPGPECPHEKTTTSYVTNMDRTHEVIVQCGTCGEKLERYDEACEDGDDNNTTCDNCGYELYLREKPESDFGKDSVVLDFMYFAYDAVRQDWFYDLRAASKTPGVRSIGSGYGTNPTNTEKQAIADVQAYLEENYCWTIEDLTAGNPYYTHQYGCRRIFIDPARDYYGIRFYTDVPGTNGSDADQLKFLVDIPKSDWYDMDIETFNEMVPSIIETCDGPDNGGATCDIIVNGEVVVENHTFKNDSKDAVETLKVYALYLEEGVNSLVFRVKGDRNGPNSTAGRCALNLRSVELIPVGACQHENAVPVMVKNERDHTHTTNMVCTCREIISSETVECTDKDDNKICDVCEQPLGERPAPTKTFGEDSVVLDFMQFAYDAIHQDWWYDLRQSTLLPSGKSIGVSYGGQMTDAQKQAIVDAEQYMKENLNWRVTDMTSGNGVYYTSPYGARQIYIDSMKDDYGIRFYPHLPGTAGDASRLKLAFTVPEGKAGRYAFDMEALNETMRSLIERHDTWDSGGATTNIYLNDKMIVKDYVFIAPGGDKGTDEISLVHFGPVDLVEGENTLDIEVTGDVWQVKQGGRCALNLRYIEFKPLTGVEATEYLTSYLDLNAYYMPYGRSAAGFKVEMDDPWIAGASIDSKGVLAVTGAKAGETTLRIYDGSKLYCTIPVRVAPFDGTLDDLMGNGLKLDFVTAVDRAQEQSWWTGTSAVTSESDLNNYLKENAKWSIASADGLTANGDDNTYGFKAEGSNTFKMELPAGGLYNVTVEYLQGGGTMDVSLNGTALYGGLSTVGEAATVKRSLGTVVLDKGENTLTVDADDEVYLRAVTVTPLGVWQTEVGISRYLDLNETYLPYDAKIGSPTAKSDNTAVVTAKFSADGTLIVTGVKEGSAKVTVTAAGQTVCTLDVVVIATGSLQEAIFTLDGFGAATLTPGETAMGELRAVTTKRTPLTEQYLRDAGSVYFKSSNTKVATVDQATGDVICVGEGTAVISAYALLNGVTVNTSAVITVTDETDLASIEAAASVDYVGIGNVLQMTVNGKKASGVSADMSLYPVTWSVDDETVASVSSDGRLTGLKPGTVTVTVTAGVQRVAITDSIVIEVVPSTELLGKDQYYDFAWSRNIELQNYTIDTHDIAINRQLTTGGGESIIVNSRGIKFDVNAGDVLALDLRIRISGWYEVELRGRAEVGAVHADGFVDDTYIGSATFYKGGLNGILSGGYNTVWLDAGVHTLKLVSTGKGQIPLGGVRFYATTDPNEVALELKAEDPELIPGEKTAVSVYAKPANDETFTLLQQGSVPNFTNYYILSSSDTDVLTVSGGTATAKSVGTADVVLVGEVDGKPVTKTLTINVKEGTVADAELTAEHTTVAPDAAAFPLILTTYGVDGKEVTPTAGTTVSYVSSDETIAKVDAQGNVTVQGSEGSALITATVNENGHTVTASVWITATVGKTEPTIWTNEERANARENVLKYDWAWSEKEKVTAKADLYVEALDILYEEVLTPQTWPGHNYITFRSANNPEDRICPMCNADLTPYNAYYPWVVDPINNPWKVTCPSCKSDFPSNDFRSYYLSGLGEDGLFHEELADSRYLVNELYPEKGEDWGVDDGWGWETGRKAANGRVLKYTFISHYIRKATYTLGDDNNFLHVLDRLSKAYLYTGDEKYGNAGAILVDRLADIYPTWDISDFPIEDYSDCDGNGGGGYQFGETWDGEAARFYAKAADAFWDCMDNPEVIDYIAEHASWKGLTAEDITPAYIRTNMEENLLLHIWEGLQTANVTGNFGIPQSACAYTAVALDRLPETQDMLDWLFRYREMGGDWLTETSYATGGGLLTTYVGEVKRDGLGNEGSLSYNALWEIYNVETFNALKGYERVASTDMWENPKVVTMYHAAARLMTSGMLGVNLHETSGAFQTPGLGPNIDRMTTAFVNTGDHTIARALYAFNGNTTAGIHADIFTKDPEYGIRSRIEKIVKEDGEWEMGRSDMMPGYGMAFLREGPAKYLGAANAHEYSHYVMYYGDTWTDHHKDHVLHLDLAAFGLTLSADLGYPLAIDSNPERLEWVANTISGNTVQVNDRGQMKIDKNGFPMHFADDGYAKVMDADVAKVYEETEVYRRTVVAVDNGDGVHYAIDFFRVLGGKEHVYSFHAASLNDPTTEGLDLIKQPMGTYAGVDIPFGADETFATSSGAGSSYSWLYNVARDDSPETVFSVDWPIMDHYHQLTTSAGIRLKLTMLSEDPMAEVATADGNPPQDGENPAHLEYVLVRNSGSDGLDTLFTTVLEPYQFNNYIEKTELVDVVLTEGTEKVTDRAAAVKVTLKSGRVDYVVYATNTECTYRVADLFDFKGFIGVVSYENGEVIYAWGDEATIVTDRITDALPRVTGEVLSFTEGLADRYEMTISMDHPLTEEQLMDKWIYVNNDGRENGAYRVYGAEVTGNTAVIDLSFQTLIRGYVDEKNLDLGIKHNISVGDTYELPLSVSFDMRDLFTHTTDKVVKAGNKFSLTTGVAGSGMAYEVEGLSSAAKINAADGTIAWTTSRTQTGRYPVTVKAVQDGEVVGEMSFVIYVVSYTGSAYDPAVCTHAKAVTYETNGFIETVCPACGTVTKTALPDEPEQPEIQKFDFVGSNMTLGNELKLNFMVNTADLKDGYYAELTHNGKTVEAKFSKFNSTYSSVGITVCAKEMADDITVTVYDADGNAVSNEYVDSVRAYAMRALAGNTTAKVKTLVVDMLNYGAAAQQHFKYNAEDLANSILTEADQADATAKITCTNGQVKDSTVYGSNLALDDKILLNTFFKGLKGKDIASMYAMVTFTGYDGKGHEVRMEGAEFEKYGSSGDIYKIVVDDIVLADAKQMVTVTLYDADGTVFGVNIDSVESYVARAEANNADTYGLYANIMKFATSAYNYIVNK